LASREDIVFCKEVLKRELLTPEQVDEGLRVVDQRKELGIQKKVRDVFIEKGLLKEAVCLEIEENLGQGKSAPKAPTREKKSKKKRVREKGAARARAAEKPRSRARTTETPEETKRPPARRAEAETPAEAKKTRGKPRPKEPAYAKRGLSSGVKAILGVSAVILLIILLAVGHSIMKEHGEPSGEERDYEETAEDEENERGEREELAARKLQDLADRRHDYPDETYLRELQSIVSRYWDTETADMAREEIKEVKRERRERIAGRFRDAKRKADMLALQGKLCDAVKEYDRLPGEVKEGEYLVKIATEKGKLRARMKERFDDDRIRAAELAKKKKFGDAIRILRKVETYGDEKMMTKAREKILELEVAEAAYRQEQREKRFLADSSEYGKVLQRICLKVKAWDFDGAQKETITARLRLSTDRYRSALARDERALRTLRGFWDLTRKAVERLKGKNKLFRLRGGGRAFGRIQGVEGGMILMKGSYGSRSVPLEKLSEKQILNLVMEYLGADDPEYQLKCGLLALYKADFKQAAEYLSRARLGKRKTDAEAYLEHAKFVEKTLSSAEPLVPGREPGELEREKKPKPGKPAGEVPKKDDQEPKDVPEVTAARKDFLNRLLHVPVTLNGDKISFTYGFSSENELFDWIVAKKPEKMELGGRGFELGAGTNYFGKLLHKAYVKPPMVIDFEAHFTWFFRNTFFALTFGEDRIGTYQGTILGIQIIKAEKGKVKSAHPKLPKRPVEYFRADHTYRIRMEVGRDKIKTFVNGVHKATASLKEPTRGRIGISFHQTRFYIRNLSVEGRIDTKWLDEAMKKAKK
jgi:hypothetical protein